MRGHFFIRCCFKDRIGTNLIILDIVWPTFLCTLLINIWQWTVLFFWHNWRQNKFIFTRLIVCKSTWWRKSRSSVRFFWHVQLELFKSRPWLKLWYFDCPLCNCRACEFKVSCDSVSIGSFKLFYTKRISMVLQNKHSNVWNFSNSKLIRHLKLYTFKLALDGLIFFSDVRIVEMAIMFIFPLLT